MLTVISPAKSLNLDPVDAVPTRPDFPAMTAQLLEVARGLSAADLSAMMKISDKLGRLNAARFADWDAAPEKPAAFAFAGDTYVGLDAPTLDGDALRWAQAHLRILSGLYGLLRPLDALRPYRLEMGTRLPNPRGRDLYAFWGDRLARALDAQAEETGARHLLNCASQEYFAAVDPTALRLPVVTPVFLDDGPKGPRVVSFHAKRARGAMARFVQERRIVDPGDLRAFDGGGYAWQADRSTPDRPVFLRTEAAARAA